MSPLAKIDAYKDKNREEWKINFDSSEDARGIPLIIETIKGGTKKNSLYEKVKEIIVTEPIKVIFSIIAATFLVWYFGLSL